MTNPLGLLAGAGAGLNVAGGVIGFIGAGRQAKAARRIGRLNAALREEEAGQALQRGVREVGRLREIVLSRVGEARAAAGAGGVAQTGTTLDISSQIFAFGERDAAFILEDAQRRSSTLRFAAEIARFTGDAQAASLELQGVGSLLGGAAGGASALIPLFA